jgi:hypothetical protein
VALDAVSSYLVPDDCISEWAIEKSRNTHPDIHDVLVNGSDVLAYCFDVLADRFDVLTHNFDVPVNRRNSILCPDHVLVNRLDLDLCPDGSLHLHTGSTMISLGTHE